MAKGEVASPPFFGERSQEGREWEGWGGLLIQRKEGTCQLHVEDEDAPPCVTTAEPETVYNSWEARVLRSPEGLS